MNGLLDTLVETHGLERAQCVQLMREWQRIDSTRLLTLAREASTRVYGKDVYLRGLLEISNRCRNDCLYCGIRKGNSGVERYRLEPDAILGCCENGYALGLRTFVLQGGEDPWFTDERLCSLVREIRRRCPDAAVTLSLGERPYESYAALREAGADRYLLRHETADAAHYATLHPEAMSFENRRRCLRDLKALGYQVGAGFMVGSPGQTPEALAEDLLFLQELRPHMIGIGPFLPHHETPFAGHPAGSVELTLILLALVRLLLPDALLPATTALGTAAGDGLERGVLAGANVIMPNMTPPEERARYLLYDGKDPSSTEQLAAVAGRMRAIGYRAAFSRGDHASVQPAPVEQGETFSPN